MGVTGQVMIPVFSICSYFQFILESGIFSNGLHLCLYSFVYILIIPLFVSSFIIFYVNVTDSINMFMLSEMYYILTDLIYDKDYEFMH